MGFNDASKPYAFELIDEVSGGQVSVCANIRVMFQKVCLFIPIVPDEVIKIAQKIDLDQF